MAVSDAIAQAYTDRIALLEGEIALLRKAFEGRCDDCYRQNVTVYFDGEADICADRDACQSAKAQARCPETGELVEECMCYMHADETTLAIRRGELGPHGE